MAANDVTRAFGDGYDSIALQRGRGDEMDVSRAELLAEGIAEVPTRALRYIQEPADGAWHDLVEALARIYGDPATYDLLRAVEIHSRISPPR